MNWVARTGKANSAVQEPYVIICNASSNFQASSIFKWSDLVDIHTPDKVYELDLGTKHAKVEADSQYSNTLPATHSAHILFDVTRETTLFPSFAAVLGK